MALVNRRRRRPRRRRRRRRRRWGQRHRQRRHRHRRRRRRCRRGRPLHRLVGIVKLARRIATLQGMSQNIPGASCPQLQSCAVLLSIVRIQHMIRLTVTLL